MLSQDKANQLTLCASPRYRRSACGTFLDPLYSVAEQTALVTLTTQVAFGNGKAYPRLEAQELMFTLPKARNALQIRPRERGVACAGVKARKRRAEAKGLHKAALKPWGKSSSLLLQKQ